MDTTRPGRYAKLQNAETVLDVLRDRDPSTSDTPLDRRALLTPRYIAVAATAVALGAGVVALAAVVAEPADPLWWPVAGTGVAAALFAAAVLLQTRPAAVGRAAAIGR